MASNPMPRLRGYGTVAKVEKVYWDSCAWLGLLNREAEKINELEFIWNKAVAGDVEIWTSTVAQLEVCKLASEKAAMQSGEPKSDALTEENLQKIENVFNQPFVKRVTLDVEISSRARRLFRETGGLGKAADAAHVVSALRWNVPTLHTYDGCDLLHLDGKLKLDDGNDLEIRVPTDLPEPDLFNEPT
jgi:predicted nucleic acid-binding protein